MFFQRNLLHSHPVDTGLKRTRFLAFDIVHAVEFSRIGRSRCSTSRCYCRGTSRPTPSTSPKHPDTQKAPSLKTRSTNNSVRSRFYILRPHGPTLQIGHLHE